MGIAIALVFICAIIGVIMKKNSSDEESVNQANNAMTKVGILGIVIIVGIMAMLVMSDPGFW